MSFAFGSELAVVGKTNKEKAHNWKVVFISAPFLLKLQVVQPLIGVGFFQGFVVCYVTPSDLAGLIPRVWVRSDLRQGLGHGGKM